MQARKPALLLSLLLNSSSLDTRTAGGDREQRMDRQERLEQQTAFSIAEQGKNTRTAQQEACWEDGSFVGFLLNFMLKVLTKIIKKQIKGGMFRLKTDLIKH